MYLLIPIRIIPIELIERVKFIKAPLRLNPCSSEKPMKVISRGIQSSVSANYLLY